MRWFLFCLSVLSCPAQQGLPPDIVNLGRIKAKMAQNLGRLPNYTCGETIERSFKMPRERKPQLIDTVRLEVALVDGHEMFGWPGSNRIAESEISTLVGGTIGNGDFGLHASSVFLSSSSVFVHKGPALMDGRPAEQYEYRVSALNSGYRLRVGANEAVVGYHGTFWVNPESLDLMRLSLVADEIPEILGLSLVTNRLDYQRVKIGNGEFLLPLGGDLTLTDYSGAEHRNRTRFENCRQYAGESVLSFADPADVSPKGPAADETLTVDLPEDFRVDVSLLTPIDSAHSAVGDPVKLQVEQNVKAGRAVLIPKGASITARISQLQRQGRFFTLELVLQSIEFERGHAGLSSRSNELTMAVAATRPNQRPGGRGGFSNAEAANSHQPVVMETARLRLYRGFLLHWHSRLLKSEK